jgi:hypothetical protein
VHGAVHNTLQLSTPSELPFHTADLAQGEAAIKPDRVLNDLGREAMAVVAERSPADILPDTPMAPDSVSVTMPLARLWQFSCAG